MPVHVTAQLSGPSQTHDVSSGAHDLFVVGVDVPASPDEEEDVDEDDEHAASSTAMSTMSGFMRSNPQMSARSGDSGKSIAAATRVASAQIVCVGL